MLRQKPFSIRHSSLRVHRFLKRNFVVFYVVAARGTTAAAAAAAARAAASALTAPASAAGLSDGYAFHVSRAVEELYVGGVDFERLPRLALAVSPLLHVEAPFDVDAPPLREILRDVLGLLAPRRDAEPGGDRQSTRLNSSHANISYAVFCLQNNTPNL